MFVRGLVSLATRRAVRRFDLSTVPAARSSRARTAFTRCPWDQARRPDPFMLPAVPSLTAPPGYAPTDSSKPERAFWGTLQVTPRPNHFDRNVKALDSATGSAEQQSGRRLSDNPNAPSSHECVCYGNTGWFYCQYCCPQGNPVNSLHENAHAVSRISLPPPPRFVSELQLSSSVLFSTVRTVGCKPCSLYDV